MQYKYILFSSWYSWCFCLALHSGFVVVLMSENRGVKHAVRGLDHLVCSLGRGLSLGSSQTLGWNLWCWIPSSTVVCSCTGSHSAAGLTAPWLLPGCLAAAQEQVVFSSHGAAGASMLRFLPGFLATKLARAAALEFHQLVPASAAKGPCEPQQPCGQKLSATVCPCSCRQTPRCESCGVGAPGCWQTFILRHDGNLIRDLNSRPFCHAECVWQDVRFWDQIRFQLHLTC